MNDTLEKDKPVKGRDARKFFDHTHKKLLQARQRFENDWKDIAQYMLPMYARFFGDDKKNSDDYVQILDDAATKAGRTLASGLMAAGPSSALPWFRIGISNLHLFELGPVKDWVSNVEEIMYQIFARSNFYEAFHSALLEEGFFGNGAFMLMEDHDDVIRCYNMTLGEYAIGQGARNEIDTCFREFKITIYQLVEMFGEDAISEAARNQLKTNQGNDEVEVVHAIMPAHTLEGLDNIERLPFDNKPYVSVYYEKGSQNNPNKDFLSVHGFEEFPAIILRWDVVGSDVYATGPGMDALGDTKSLQFYKMQLMTGTEKENDPPLQYPSSLQLWEIDDDPGGRTQADGDGIKRLYDSRFEGRTVAEVIEQLKRDIRETFFADLFKALLNDNRSGTTAREVQEVHEEKLLQLGPASGRIHGSLKQVIDRVFAIANRNGLLPPPPEELPEGTLIDVEFISVLAQAQRAVGTATIDTIAGYIGNLAAAMGSSEPWDKFDHDQSIDEYAERVGNPPKIIRSDDDVAEIRAQRQQAIKAQQAGEAAAAAAQTGQTLSQTPLAGGESALDVVLASLGR